jgi:hypothetical protein
MEPLSDAMTADMIATGSPGLSTCRQSAKQGVFTHGGLDCRYSTRNVAENRSPTPPPVHAVTIGEQSIILSAHPRHSEVTKNLAQPETGR